MNKANNERFHATEEKIIDAFTRLLSEKELSEITVSEICRLCGIHRTSFYLHFQDVYGLMETIERRFGRYYADLFEKPEADYNLGRRFQRLFTFIYEHRDFYTAYWQRSNDLSVLDAALSTKAEGQMKRTAVGYGICTEAELQYHRVFFKAGLAALIGFWLSRGCPEMPEELSEILRKEYEVKNHHAKE